MCGIAGSVNYRLDHSKLNRDLKHRGPDEQTVFEEGVIQFFHYRLSILDIAGGKQPMHTGPLTIIFNGEIYNHLDVRRKFNLRCQTSSDTETILLAYEKLGPDCLDEFDGMFAVVIYDRAKQSLFIARDRSGKKPIYYYQSGNTFVFASELNALHNQVQTTVLHENINQYLRYGAFHAETTPYNEIRELPAGSFVTVNIPDATLKVEKWWDIFSFYEKRSRIQFNEALDATNEALYRSIKRRIESSDLEVGCFLSGGIDSGLVTSIAAGMKNGLKTFTVSFPGVYNEAPLARKVADKYATQHTEINISFENLQENIEMILANYGEPFYDDSAIPSYYVSREARKYLTVILNGDGADEVFGGYRRYLPFARYDFFSKPGFITTLAAGVKKLIPFSKTKQSFLNYFYRLADFTSMKGVEVFFSAGTDIFCGSYSKYLTFPGNEMRGLNELMEKISQSDLTGLQKIMCMDFKSILPDILLVKMDIACMANSLEGRSPFLSKDILEFAPGLPDEYKIKGRTTKVLLRKLATRYLPEELISQPKRGFEVPLQKWVNGELKEIINDYLQSPGSYVKDFVKRDFIQRLLDNKVSIHGEKRAKILYTLFALDVWYHKCVKNGG